LRTDRKPLGTLALVAVTAILLSAVALAVNVDAARGGKGGGGTSTASLTVSPNPVPAYTHPTVSGTGFKAGETLLVGIPGDWSFTRITADSGGAFSFVYTARELSPATYTMEAWGQANSGKWVFRASVTITAV
jgi:hypothetical protein